MATFAENLKELRKAAHITQAELAEKLNVHLQTVSKWERGVSEPDIAQVGDLAAAVGVPLERLVGAEETAETYVGHFDAVLFGKNLAELRKQRGERQETLAESLHTTSDAVSKWERGVICPDLMQMCALAQHYGVPFSKLYFGIGETERTETPVQARRRKRISFAWLGGTIVLGAALICTVLLAVPKTQASVPEQGSVAEEDENKDESEDENKDENKDEIRYYTVTVDGTTHEVSEYDWFTLADAERDGYDFVGYADESGAIADFPVKVTEDTAFTAVFRPHEYTIDYWLNGGYFYETPQNTFTVESGTLELPIPFRQGAVFEGWYLAADYAGDAVGNLVCAGADVSVYARWSDAVCTVRYELGGGILYGSNPVEVTQQEEVVLSEPVREGYNFLGWYDTPTGGNRYESVGGERACNVTLYALWQECGDLFTVRYETCGGTMTEDNPLSVGAGEVHLLNGATRTGYTFLGWNTAADGSGEYVEALYGIREDLTLYAVWQAKTYIVRYELNGGTFEDTVNPNVIAYGTTVELAPLVRYGQVFLGWYDAETGGNKVDHIGPDNILRLTTLYARFSPVQYTIRLIGAGGTFEADGQRVDDQTFTLYYGDEVTLPECLRVGYDFLGWFDADGRRYEQIDATNLGDLTLTAVYRESNLTYRVEYVLNGGILSEENPVNVGYGQVVMLHAPERYGYLFLGWNDRADGSGDYYTQTPAGRETALTLYAIWQEIVVSGSADSFLYEKGQASVTITGYTGEIGENVDLAVPSYIDGLPVVALEGRLVQQGGTLHSLTFPETLVRLGADIARDLVIASPVVIPAQVKSIGEMCFAYSVMTLEFAQGSMLSAMEEKAFYSATVRNIITLPEGVTRLERSVFELLEVPGIMLPPKLEYISGNALGLSAFSTRYYETPAIRYYLPTTVKYVEANAFTAENEVRDCHIYTNLSAEETSAFAPGWNGAFETYFDYPDYSGVTLDFGDGKREFLAGPIFALPEPQKEGYRFVGWYDARENMYAAPLYVPFYEGAVLQAVYEAVSDHDGRSGPSPAVPKAGEQLTFILSPLSEHMAEYYICPQTGSGRLRIIADGIWQDHPHGAVPVIISIVNLQTQEEILPGIGFSYEQGSVLCIGIVDFSPYLAKVNLRVEIVE